MKKTIIILMIFFSVLQAEPSTSVKWLMNEPASLFDIGTIQMRMKNQNQWTPKLIEKITTYKLKPKNVGFGSVVYSFDKNTITVGAYFIGEPNKKTCSAVLQEYKKIIIPSGSEKMRYKFASNTFSHINYINGGKSENLSEEISKLFVYTIGISKQEKIGGKSIFCISNINSDTPIFQKFSF